MIACMVDRKYVRTQRVVLLAFSPIGAEFDTDEHFQYRRQRYQMQAQNEAAFAPDILRFTCEHSPVSAPRQYTCNRLLLRTSRAEKMKSAVMALACAAGAQAFVAPRLVHVEGVIQHPGSFFRDKWWWCLKSLAY